MRLRPAILVAFLMPLAVSVPAADGGVEPPSGPGGDRAESVRVYTNRDLERFGPPDDTTAAPPRDPGWEFVTDFLEREYRRLDADRAFDLERRRVEAETEAIRRRPDHWHLPVAPFVTHPVGPRRFRHGYHPGRGRGGRPHGGFGLPSVNSPPSVIRW